jgi:2-amino-4-hydroxy-6-hydroxymethyldihydropteridine diphosphokinase
VTRAVLSVGSNLGDRLGHLRTAVAALGPALLAASPVYETAPWGGVEQDDYLNAVLVVDDADTDARGWLDRARALEAAAGRAREVRWGPRTLDVDVVLVDGVRSDDAELTLPHPRAHERAFVLVPWADVDPDAVLPGYGRVADLAARLDRSGVRRRPDLALLPRTAQPGSAYPTGRGGSARTPHSTEPTRSGAAGQSAGSAGTAGSRLDPRPGPAR